MYVIPIFIFLMILSACIGAISQINSYTILSNTPSSYIPVTVVIPSFNRPHNFDISLPYLCAMKSVNEIIISHGQPSSYKIAPKFQHPKIKHLKNYNNEYGATQRFFAALKAQNNIIIYLDDDMIPSEDLVNKLALAVQKESIGLYGPLSRRCDKRGYGIKGNDTILTPILATSKIFNQSYISHFHWYKDLLRDTHGNGEDLTYNLFLRKYYNTLPTKVSGKYYWLDKSNGYSSKGNHFKIRNKICKNLSLS